MLFPFNFIKGRTRDVQGTYKVRTRCVCRVRMYTLKEFYFIFALKTNGDRKRAAAYMKEIAN